MNFHLQRAGYEKTVKNFSSDLKVLEHVFKRFMLKVWLIYDLLIFFVIIFVFFKSEYN